MNVELIFNNNRWLAFIPIAGIISYVIFYLIGAQNYASGLEDFSMGNHLLCDLMNSISKEGHPNTGRLTAIIGNSFLFVGMVTFFYLIPLLFKQKNTNIKCVQVLGVIAMFNFLFLFTEYHDILILASGCLCTIMVTLLIIEYCRQAHIPARNYAIFCLVLSLMVFVSYQFEICIDVLPVFQKIVFLLDGIWVFISCFALKNFALKNLT